MTITEPKPAPAGHLPLKMWTRGVAVEEAALEQLRALAGLPVVYGVAAMPDLRAGPAAPAGCVLATRGAIVPAALGVDLGCGVAAVMTSLTSWDLPDDTGPLRAAVAAAVPHGRTGRGGPSDKGAWQSPPAAVLEAWTRTPGRTLPLAQELRERLAASAPELAGLERKAPAHLGTLGSGGHYIEVCLDELDRVWVTVHAGSRGPGHAVAAHLARLAEAEVRRLDADLPDPGLAWLDGDVAHVVACAAWAQDCAQANRLLLLDAALAALKRALGRRFRADTPIDSPHNHLRRETHDGRELWVARNGALRAARGDLAVTIDETGARSLIVRGRGKPDAYRSCAHSTGTDPVATLAAQADLAEPVHSLRQVVRVPG